MHRGDQCMYLNQRNKIFFLNNESERIARFVFALIFDRDPGLLRHESSQVREEELVRYATDHLVATSIGSRSTGWDDLGLSQELGDYFVACHVLNTQRNEACLVELAEIGVLLNSINVSPTLLKGASGLVRNLYPTLGFRTLSDIDILVPENQFFNVISCLKKNGFVCPHEREEEYFLQRDFNTVQEYPVLVAEGKEFAIDLHKYSAIHLKEFRRFEEHLKKESKKVSVGGACFLQPSKRFHAAHALYHTMIQDLHGVTGFVRMRHVVDYTAMREVDNASRESDLSYFDDQFLKSFHLYKQYEQSEALSSGFRENTTLSLRNVLALRYPEAVIQSGRFLSYFRGAMMSPSKFFSKSFYRTLISRYRRSVARLPKSE